MESMSHDPVAGDIGSQLIDIAMQGLDSDAASMMQLTLLIPAGGEEVSMQAALAFAAEGAQMLAGNTAAQQELTQTGMALVNILRSTTPPPTLWRWHPAVHCPGWPARRVDRARPHPRTGPVS